ncbi:MAG TPA: diguanylate cyclase [Drouetiella sp.]
MSNIYGAPNGIERRAYRTTNATLANIPALVAQQTITGKQGDPLKQTCTREYLLQILDGQIELALENTYPMCIILAEFKNSDGTAVESEAVLHAVAQQFCLHLRPTDIIVRFRNKTIAMILRECADSGARQASQRLSACIADGIRVDAEKISIKPLFGYSAQITRDTDRANKLLTGAEHSLKALVG